jgi:hypothetical protein
LRISGGTLTGIALGSLVVHLLRVKGEEYEPLLVLIGTVLLAAGVSYSIGVPVIYVTVITGIYIANARPRLHDFYPVLATSERPMYLLFLILAGALWNPSNMQALFVALILIVIRFGAKWWSFRISRKFVDIPGWGGHLALALVSPGGIAVAIVVNFALFADRFPLTDFVLDVTVWALIILSPLGVPLARRALAVAEEKS